MARHYEQQGTNELFNKNYSGPMLTIEKIKLNPYLMAHTK